MSQTYKNNARVVIVDDSLIVRNLFLASIWTEAGMNVIATGKDGKDAVKYPGDVKISSPTTRNGEQ